MQFKYELNHGLEPLKLFQTLAPCLRQKLFGELYGDILHHVPLFDELNLFQKEEIANLFTPQLYMPKDVIVYQKSAGQILYLMQHGRAEVIKEDQEQIVLATIYEGELFGEISFFHPSHKTRIASIHAVTFCQVLQLDRIGWQQFCARIGNEQIHSLMVEKVSILQTQLDKNLETKIKQNNNKNSNNKNQKQQQKQQQQQQQQVSSSSSSVSHASLLNLIYSKKKSTPPIKQPSKINRIRVVPSNEKNTIEKNTFSSSSSSSSMTTMTMSTMTKKSPPPSAGRSLMHERSLFRYIWDSIKLLTVLYYAFVIPLRVSFYFDLQTSGSTFNQWQNIEYVLDVFYGLDLYLRCTHFTIVVFGEEKINQKECRYLYLHQNRKQFIYDLIGSIPFETIGYFFKPKIGFWRSIWKLFVLIRCFQFEMLFLRVKKFLFYELKLPSLFSNENAIEYLQICFVAFISCHWIGCLWFFVSKNYCCTSFFSFFSQMDVVPTWLSTPYMLTSQLDLNIDQVSFLTKYLRSYYFAIETLSTVTYGDIAPRNIAETLTQMVIIFVCVTFFGLITDKQRTILQQNLSKRIDFEQNLEEMNHFGTNYGISQATAYRLCKFLNETWQNQQVQIDHQHHHALRLLSPNLRSEIFVFLRQKLFETIVQVLIGDDEESQETKKDNKNTKIDLENIKMIIQALVVACKEENYDTNDIIYHEFEFGTNMYFVQKGTVLLQNCSKSFQKLKKKGDFFGHFSLLYGLPRKETSMALTKCHLAVLSKNEYEKIIELFPEHQQLLETKWIKHTPTTY
jgi:CRP-like cAMP-binding protein